MRSTGAVAANASDGDWRRQLQVLRAGLTGTAVCLGDPGAVTSPKSVLEKVEMKILSLRSLDEPKTCEGFVSTSCVFQRCQKNLWIFEYEQLQSFTNST